MPTILYYLLLLFNLNSSPFCSCWPLSVEDSFKNSGAVFSGRVLKVDTIKLYSKALPKDAFRELHLATIKINQSYKGKNIADTTFIMTGEGGGDCGYDFRLDSSYIFYANVETYTLIDSTNYKTRKYYTSNKTYLSTTVCSRTTLNIKSEDFLLKQFLSKNKSAEIKKEE
jgi:hypothetical protein